jgi:uncharacterized protein (UPF0276 family)
MTGLGYRREMSDWPLAQLQASFFEVVPENWLRRDRSPLHALRSSGRAVHLHGVSLNLGGRGAFDAGFVRSIAALCDELGGAQYSDHLSASGDAHQLYDLFPIPFTRGEARRVADRILQVQELLGRRMAVENATWYTNVGDMPELDFMLQVLDWADCDWLLDLNNIEVNRKNHGGPGMADWLAQVPWQRVRYVHVAGHEFNERLGMHIDTHSEPVETSTRHWAHWVQREKGKPVLLEWDNDLPSLQAINEELQCLLPLTPATTSTPMCAA